ncbi:MAG TPA: hypothetical protein VIM58_05550 [Candidatus Methylacidiphilales bacterium]
MLCVATVCAVTLALPVIPLRAELSDIPYADVDRTAFSPYIPQGTRFLPNPVAARLARGNGGSKEMLADADVALPPLPDALKPLGPAKVAPTSIIAELPNPKTSTTENAASKPQAKEDQQPEAPEVVMETPAPKPASNAFLDWVRANKDAEELAKQQRRQYGADSKKKGDDDADGDSEDLLLNIRQPYTWNQEAPTTRSGSSVIYTVPSR